MQKQRKQRSPKGHKNPEQLRHMADGALTLVNEAFNQLVRSAKDPMAMGETCKSAYSIVRGLVSLGTEAEIATAGSAKLADGRRLAWVKQQIGKSKPVEAAQP